MTIDIVSSESFSFAAMCEVFQLELKLCEDITSLCSLRKLATKICDVSNDMHLGSLTISKSQNFDATMKPPKPPLKSLANSSCPPAKKPRLPVSAPVANATLGAPIMGKRDVTSLINTIIKPDSKEKAFQCSFCMYQSALIQNVKRHIELKHLPSSVVFKCQTCGKDFKMKADLKKHYIKIHSMPEPAARAMLAG